MKVKINKDRVLEIWFEDDSEIYALRKWVEEDRPNSVMSVPRQRKLTVHPFKDNNGN